MTVTSDQQEAMDLIMITVDYGDTLQIAQLRRPNGAFGEDNYTGCGASCDAAR